MFSIEYLPDAINLKGSIESFMEEWHSDKSYIETHTSGSTGKPKTICLEKNYMRASARATNLFFNLEENNTALLCLSVQTIAGKMMIIRAMEARMNLIVTSVSSNFYEKIDKVIDFAAVVPLQLASILNANKINLFKSVIVGGAPVSEKLKEKIFALKMNCFETFGMTETVSHIALKNLLLNEQFFTCLPNITFETINNELILTAPYLGITDLKTNDIVKKINENQFEWLGRADFVINSGGKKIHPEQIEKSLGFIYPNHHFFAFGMKHEILGNELIVAYHSIISKIEEELGINIDFKCENQSLISKYEWPKKFIKLPEFSFLKNGKLNRMETKKMVLSAIYSSASK